LIAVVCKTEVCQDYTAAKVRLHYKHILWLNISVSDGVGVHILYGENNLASNDTAVPVVEATTMRLYVREKIPTRRQLCENVPNSILDHYLL
jgi:hypothetical protein